MNKVIDWDPNWKSGGSVSHAVLAVLNQRCTSLQTSIETLGRKTGIESNLLSTGNTMKTEITKT